MNQEQLEHFRNLLLSEKRKLVEAATATLKGELELSSDDMPDENDLASALYDQGFTLRMRDRERGLIVKIDRALRLIEEGEYGYCSVCDDDIDLRRLEARPVTTMCIECKEDSERRERTQQFRGGSVGSRRSKAGDPTRARALTGTAADMEFASDEEVDDDIEHSVVE